MQAKDHRRTSRSITTIVIASVVLGGCLSQEEFKEPSSGDFEDTPTNSAPVITGNPTSAVNVGDIYSFIPTTSDADGDALTFSIENKPTWASFNSSTGELIGQPTIGDVGLYQDMRISVTDGTNWASLRSFAVRVNQTATLPPSCDSTPTTYNDENGPPSNGIVIGDLATKPDTFHSIGFVWDIDGDADHDGSVSVRYRKAGACNFATAMALIRNDYAWFWRDERATQPTNNFAGSLMFLTPGTTYEVVLELSDPDGGRAIRVLNLTTRAIPRKPTAGRTLYVVPGSGGGDGSAGNPFQGIEAANAAALPGDRMLLRNGTYSKATLSTSGAEGNHIVWEPDTGHSPVLDALAITGDHIWIDQLDFVWNDPTSGATPILDQGWQVISAIYVPPPPNYNEPDDIVITNSTFTGFANGILSIFPISRWVAMDNTVVGSRDAGVGSDPSGNTGSSSGRGIALGGEGTPGGPGCVIAYNSITRTADGMGISADGDVYGNRVWDNAGNALSMDGSYSNVRVWGNQFQDGAGAPMSWQPQKLGPWYWLYNQIGQSQNTPFKFRTLDRNVFVNNTFLGVATRGQSFMKFFMRNNLFIVYQNSSANWNTGGGDPTEHNEPQYYADWNTDIDYDGFAPGGSNFFYWFGNTTNYSSIAAWSAAVGGGAEANAIEVDPDLIFDDYTIDPFHSLELAAGPNTAVDAGQVVDNLSDFHGSTPDLGAHQRDAAPMPFGPRGRGTPLDQQVNYWAKH